MATIMNGYEQLMKIRDLEVINEKLKEELKETTKNTEKFIRKIGKQVDKIKRKQTYIDKVMKKNTHLEELLIKTAGRIREKNAKIEELTEKVEGIEDGRFAQLYAVAIGEIIDLLKQIDHTPEIIKCGNDDCIDCVDNMLNNSLDSMLEAKREEDKIDRSPKFSGKVTPNKKMTDEWDKVREKFRNGKITIPDRPFFNLGPLPSPGSPFQLKTGSFEVPSYLQHKMPEFVKHMNTTGALLELDNFDGDINKMLLSALRKFKPRKK